MTTLDGCLAELEIDSEGIVTLRVLPGSLDDGFDWLTQQLGHIEHGAANNCPSRLTADLVAMEAEWHQSIANRSADDAACAHEYAETRGRFR